MKSKVFKKVAAFVTATTMAMGTFAVLPEEYLSEICLTVSAAEITASGQCGDNVFWELDENGTLTISGTGNMYEESGQPFYDYRAKIKKIIIQSGVTSISNSIFYHLYELTNVSIPDTVTSIGNSAFYQCEIITSISIPNSVTSIGDHAFTNCFALKNINIPFGVTVIDDYAFSNCRSLSNITLPNSIAKIGECSFYKCWELGNITIPDSVTSIGMGAFSDCEKMTNMIIPDSVNTMGDQVFESCSGLRSVKLSSKVSTISKQTFMSCSSLEEVIIPEGVTSIGEAAFIYCSNLKTVNFPSTLKTLDGWAFDSCSSITEINIPDGVTSIGQSAFRLCTSLTKATIPASVTSIGNYAFVGDDLLTIYGYKGTVAETYANENSIPFVALDGEEPIVPTLDPDKYLSFACTSGKTEFTYDALNKKFKPDSSMLSCSLFYNQLPTTESEIEYFFTINKIEITAPQGFSFGENGSPNYLEMFGPADIYTIDNGDLHASYDFQIPLYPISYSEEGEFDLTIKVYGDNDFVKTFNQKISVKKYQNPVDINSEYDETDTDGDGLPDVWEINGYTYNGVFVDLPAMGADPNVPDIFVEVDWMDEYDPTEYADSLYIVYKQFKNHGINLHIDAGSDSFDYVTKKPWGELSAANEIPFTREINVFFGTDTSVTWKNTINKYFLSNQARSLSFRYCIMGDRIITNSIGDNDGKITQINTGIACGIPSQYFVVSLGLICDALNAGNERTIAIAGTFMHELGHTLGLYHGGIDGNGCGYGKINYKPNYLSIMNYSFQTSGLCFSEPYHGDYTREQLVKYINYSDYDLPSLDENNLNEADGVDPEHNTKDGICTKWYLFHQYANGKSSYDTFTSDPLSEFTGEAYFDFNFNGECDISLSLDINQDGKTTILAETTNDWEHIKYKGGCIGGNGAALSHLLDIFNTDEFKFDIPEEAPANELLDTHTHNYGTSWKSDSVSHWHECACGDKTDIAQHVSNGGKVTVQPTATSTGLRVYSCSVCGYVLRTETIPATGYIDYPSYPTYPTYPTYTPVTTTPSVFNEKLSVKAEISEGTVTLIWNEIKNADKYVVYQYKNGKYVKVKTTADTSVTFKKLKNGETYKFLVRYTINGKLSPTTYSCKYTIKVYYKPIANATVAQNSVKLTWKTVPRAKKYAIYKYVDGKAVKLAVVKGTSVKINKLSSNTEYKYIVRAYVDGKWTTMTKSDIVTIKTKAE